MARTMKPEDYAAKRDEILDVAQRLIYSRGYEQMSIQDILDALHISKGAFYHYFDSKQALLQGIVERTVQQIEQILLPVVHDPKMPALKKFQICMDLGAQWKTARLDLMFALLHVWYNDDNALARQKITKSVFARVRPWMAEIFRQGMEQGAMSTPIPEQAALVILTLMEGMADAVAHLLMSITPTSTPQQRKTCLSEMANISSAYNSAIERFLGLKNGSLELFGTKIMKTWVNYPGSAQAEAAGATGAQSAAQKGA